jgi:flagellar hook assembly protein FlgD
LFGWGILNALSAVTSVGGLQTIPTTYSLLQNYPNPFNPKTTIQYYLPQSSVVSLKVYNLLGQEVRTLVSAARESSLKTIEWNGTNNSGNILASGVYFARLNAKSIDNTISYTETRKLVLSK